MTTHHLYLAGPMRGIPAFNFPAFHDAAYTLREQGHLVFNPAERDADVGFDPVAQGYTGHEDLSRLGFSLRSALAADLNFITRHATAVCVLPGWETSRGANAEVATARALGLPVYAYDVDALDGLRLLEVESVVDAEPAPVTSLEEVRMVSETGGEKGSKMARHDLIPTRPLDLLARLYGRGAAKYADRNWERGYDWGLSYAALQRHANAFWSGEDIDPEMGLPHVTAVAWHAFVLAEFMATHPEFDNRPSTVAQRREEEAA